MKVILAQPRGFCAGVVRAIDIVERALEKYGAPVYVRHEIVHNGHVVESLKAKGARFVESLAKVPRGAPTIFSVVYRGPSKRRRSTSACRFSTQPEVEGTMGRIPGPAYLVQSEEDVAALELAADTPLAYVTQTTLSVDDTRSIIMALKRRFSDIVGPETKNICYATQNRQSTVRELSRHVDVILVVGAKNSSNSNRLREIGAEAEVPSYLIADRNDLDLDVLRGAATIGVTAGASAPEVLVHEVVEALRSLGPLELTTLPRVQEDIEFRLPSELLDA